MGRGLAAILPRATRDGEGLREIAVELIEPNPRQPRRAFDEEALATLAGSIRPRRRLALDARDGGWSVRQTEDNARAAEHGTPEPRAPRTQVVVHPDLAEALAAAEDALSAALGREVRVRARGDRCRVEVDLDTPA